MIIRKSADNARLLRFGCSGDAIEIAPKAINTLLYALPTDLKRPFTCVPLKYRRLARVAMLANARVYQGFAFHNACYEITPGNAKQILSHAKPDYFLAESCIYDSARAWPLACFKPGFGQQLGKLATLARNAHVPSILWFTLDASLAAHFFEAAHAFDFVACADEHSLDLFKHNGINAHYMPWGFSPEIFNPLVNSSLASDLPPMLLFDGISRMMRFAYVRKILEKCHDCNLSIVDSSMLVPPYNIERFSHPWLKEHIHGCVSQTFIQELYKTSTASLVLGDEPEKISPLQQCRALEAAACACPALYAGADKAARNFLQGFCSCFSEIDNVADFYRHLASTCYEKDIAAHPGWRNAHSLHTFAHRMDAIHKWIGLDKMAVENPLASVIVPTIRPPNFQHVFRQYERQNYPAKELVYVFNGDTDDLPPIPANRNDIRVLTVPKEYTTGMVMNAGMAEASGECVFKFDDDDLYGANYVADRMIYFREFGIDALSNAHTFFRFGNQDKAYISNVAHNAANNEVYSLGNAAYSIVKYTGCSVAMRRHYAGLVNFQEQAYAHEDVSVILKGIFLTPITAYVQVPGFNMCVTREDKGHTWVASKNEIMNWLDEREFSLSSVFV